MYNIVVQAVAPLSTGTGVRSATMYYAVSINTANTVIVQAYIQGVVMASNGGNYSITITPSIINSSTIQITAATADSTTVSALNYSLLIYDQTVLLSMPNRFADYGSVSSSSGNWAGLSAAAVLTWWNSSDPDFMAGLTTFSYSSSQPIKFSFSYTSMTWSSSSNFLTIAYSFWSYREAVPCTTGFVANGTTSNCIEICGDGKLYNLPCDDGNLVNGDGCSSTCAIQTGWKCSGGSTSSPDVCTEICGDGILFVLSCDDGNKVNGDGCSSTCAIETGFNCTGGSSTTASTCTEICGDGILFNLACDDGNTVSGDGCSSICTLQTGWNCPGGSSTKPSVCAQICGDGILFVLPCDDGNKANGDGCDSKCTIQTGYNCTGGSPTSASICAEICGDGILFNLACDDGNTRSGDGCSSTCALQTGWNCPGGSTTKPSVCTEICGDGLLFVLPCDDGNKINGDGCSSTCAIQSGYSCSGSPSVCGETCGDGILIYLPCDDGNTANGDGCSSVCTIEDKWNCTGGSLTSPSVCYEIFQLEIELANTVKSTSNNTVAFYFSLSPVSNELANLDYSQIITTNFSGVTLSYTYLGNGQLEVIADYGSTNLQGQNISLLVDPSKSSLAFFGHYVPSTYMFQVDPDNNIPAYPYDSNTYQRAKIFEGISLAIGLVFLGVFFVSLFSKRYIGVEMLGVAQVAFYGLMIIDFWEPVLASLSNLVYVNGFNVKMKEGKSDAMETPRRLSGLQIDSPMLSNYNYVLALMILPFFLSLVFFIGSKITKLFSRQQRLFELSKIALCEYGFTAVVALEYRWVTSWEVFAMYESDTKVTELSSSLAVLALSATVVIGVLVLFKTMQPPFGEFKSAFRKTTFCQNYYWVLLGSRFVLSSIIVFGNTFDYIGFICMLVPVTNIIILSLKKPYRAKSDVYRAIANEALTLGILAIYTYYAGFVTYTAHQQSINQLLPYAVMAMLCACVALNLTYLIKNIILYLRQKQQFREDKKMAAKYKQEAEQSTSMNRAVTMLRKKESIAHASSKQVDSSMRRFMQPESVSPARSMSRKEPATNNISISTITVQRIQKSPPKPRVIQASIENTLLQKEITQEPPPLTLKQLKERYLRNP